LVSVWLPAWITSRVSDSLAKLLFEHFQSSLSRRHELNLQLVAQIVQIFLVVVEGAGWPPEVDRQVDTDFHRVVSSCWVVSVRNERIQFNETPIVSRVGLQHVGRPPNSIVVVIIIYQMWLQLNVIALEERYQGLSGQMRVGIIDLLKIENFATTTKSTKYLKSIFCTTVRSPSMMATPLDVPTESIGTCLPCTCCHRFVEPRSYSQI
jgi:hypothetical protein